LWYSQAITIDSACPSLGVENFITNNSNVYPNPTNGKVFIDNLGSSTTVSVYNSLGQEVETSSHLQNDKTIIDLSNLPNAVYFVKITSNNQTKIQKIIKN